MRAGLTEELRVQLEGMQLWHSYQNKIEAVKMELKVLGDEIKQLELASNKEDKDVMKLENGGLHAFYLKVRGKYEETRDREVLEAAEAKVRLNNKRFEEEDAKRRLELLQAEQRKYEDCEVQYSKLYRRKEEELLATENKDSIAIFELRRKCSVCEHNIKELREAIQAGKELLSALECVEESLGDAEDWGVFDIMGGGLMSDLMKHSHLDDAKSELNHVQELMGAFRTELADVRMTFDITIDTDGFAKTADMFLDGLFFDLTMQERIHDAQFSVEDSIQEVKEKLEQLENLCTQESDKVKEYEEKIVTIVNQA